MPDARWNPYFFAHLFVCHDVSTHSVKATVILPGHGCIFESGICGLFRCRYMSCLLAEISHVGRTVNGRYIDQGIIKYASLHFFVLKIVDGLVASRHLGLTPFELLQEM